MSYTAACVERNFCADLTLLNPCIVPSPRYVGIREFSTHLFLQHPRS